MNCVHNYFEVYQNTRFELVHQLSNKCLELELCHHQINCYIIRHSSKTEQRGTIHTSHSVQCLCNNELFSSIYFLHNYFTPGFTVKSPYLNMVHSYYDNNYIYWAWPVYINMCSDNLK